MTKSTKSTIGIDVESLKTLFETAIHNGTERAALVIALDWANLATAEISKLRKELKEPPPESKAEFEAEIKILQGQRNASNRMIEQLQDELAHKAYKSLKLDKVDAVIEAAKWANFCPDAGGYADGRSVETCYEDLNIAVNNYYGTNIDTPMQEWITEEELNTMLGIV